MDQPEKIQISKFKFSQKIKFSAPGKSQLLCAFHNHKKPPSTNTMSSSPGLQLKHALRGFCPLAWDAVVGYDVGKKQLAFSSLSSDLQATLLLQVPVKNGATLATPSRPVCIDVKKLYACVRSVTPKDEIDFAVREKLGRLYFFVAFKNQGTSTFSLPLWPSENEPPPVLSHGTEKFSFKVSVPAKKFQTIVNHHLTVSGSTQLFCAATSKEVMIETTCKDTGTQAISRLPHPPHCALPSRHESGGLRSHSLGLFPLSTLRALGFFGHSSYAPQLHFYTLEASPLLYFTTSLPDVKEKGVTCWQLHASLPQLEDGEIPPPPIEIPPPVPPPPPTSTSRPIKRKKKNPPAQKPGVLKPLPGGKLLDFQDAEKKYRPFLFCNPEKGLWLPGHQRAPVWPNQMHSEEVAASHEHVCQYNWCLYPLDRPEKGHETNNCPHLFAKAKADLAADVTGSGTESALQGWLSCWDMHSQVAASQIPWNHTYL